MAEKLRFFYDKDNDILDISVGKPKKAISQELGNDVLVRVSLKTNKIIGFTILNFEKRFKLKKESQSLPIEAEFISSFA